MVGTQKDVPFMMEVCERMDSDKKGGHLARRKADGKLVLRESAQCCAQDAYNFHVRSTARGPFFNYPCYRRMDLQNCFASLLTVACDSDDLAHCPVRRAHVPDYMYTSMFDFPYLNENEYMMLCNIAGLLLFFVHSIFGPQNDSMIL